MKRESQEDRLLHLLENWRQTYSDGWVPLPVIMNLHLASHSKIVSNLRKSGHVIELERQHKADGQMWTRYRLVRNNNNSL